MQVALEIVHTKTGTEDMLSSDREPEIRFSTGRFLEKTDHVRTGRGDETGNHKRKRSCPKCGGFVYPGGVRFGDAAGDIETCLSCGLGGESESYYDALKEIYRSQVPPHGEVKRGRFFI